LAFALNLSQTFPLRIAFFSSRSAFSGVSGVRMSWVRDGKVDRMLHLKTISAGDCPWSFGVFRHSHKPSRNASERMSPPVFATSHFIAFTPASAWPFPDGI